MRRVLVAMMFGLTACQPAAETAEDAPAPPPEQPLMQARPVVFEAMSNTAQAFTGAITLTAELRTSDAPPAMKLVGANGLTFHTELVSGAAEQAERVDWSVLFGQEVVVTGNPARGAPSVDVHRVVREDVPSSASNGGYCGKSPTHFIAMATGLEVQGQPYMSIAAFRGDVWPPVNETDLCGVFNYAPPTPQ